ncbi:hypothetical protein BKA62DRAFT_798795 [Auriculariales sp. MPI-PUGE-AT-0066]|nr:hypothetical protein BKA62DRAFT_798795 [Auriculariales sp. MPI-PUGE-AT-0066]
MNLSPQLFFTLSLFAFLIWLFRVARAVVENYLLRTFTAVTELAHVGSPRATAPIRGNAVICGGSFAGLFTARICASHFDKVVVIEPEGWTFTDEAVSGAPHATRLVDDQTHEPYHTVAHSRSRVYQYLSVHLYQVFLTRFLRAIFPTFDASAKRRGARFTAGDPMAHIGGRRVLFSRGSPKSDYNNEGLFLSRRTLETLVRRLVKATCSNVHFVNGTVMNFTLGADSAIQGVVIRTADESTTEIPCCLVADCTGNTQVGYKILNRAIRGLNLRRDEYNPNFNLVTLEFPSPPDFDEQLLRLGIPGISTLADASTAPFFHLGAPDVEADYKTVVAGRSDDRIVIAVGGSNSELPTTLDGVREYASGVVGSSGVDHPVPDHYYAILDLLEPVAGKATAFLAKCVSCSRVYYESASEKLPRNFVAIGDSSLRLNPRAGEGVTKAAIGVATLDGVLRDSHLSNASLSAEYFKRLESRTAHLWIASKLADYGMPSTIPARGESLSNGTFVRAALNSLNAVMSEDSTKFWRSDGSTARAFWNCMQFTRPPTDLLTARTLFGITCEAAWRFWSSYAMIKA